MRGRPIAVVAAALAAVAACDDPGMGPETGLTEPIQINGQFIPGDLPGTPPAPADAAAAASPDGGVVTPLTIKSINFNGTEIQPGLASKSLGGSVTMDAVAVGVRMARFGTGYWVVPVGTTDPTDSTAVTFGISAGFQPDVPPGRQDLLFVALDGSGRGGPQYRQSMCFDNRIPDNGHACSPDVAPPSAVFSLRWDANFDLDLHVVTPAGVDLNPKQPFGGNVEAGVHGIDPSLTRIDRDSLRSCVPDVLRQEDAVFQTPLEKGVYTVSVDPFAACGQAAVRFTFTIYQSSGKCPDCQLVAGSSVSGELLASQVTGGIGTPLKIDTIPVGL
jgi:hypothetical protein